MQTRKIIKKLVQLAVVLLIILLSIPAIAYLLLQSSRIQTYTATNIARVLSTRIGSEITVNSVNISFLYRIRLNDVLLKDIYGDTMIYSGNVIVGIRSTNPLTRSLSFGSIDINEAFVNFKIDSSDNLNLSYFIDRLRRQEPTVNKWELSFNNIRVNDSRFYLRNRSSESKDFGINFGNLEISALNADISRFDVSPDSVTFHINSLNFNESSGFRLSNLECDFTQGDSLLKFKDIEILTARSLVKGDLVSMTFEDYRKFKPDYLFNDVSFDIRLQGSVLDLYDLAYFAPAFRDASQKFTISGLFEGPLNNIKGSEISIGFGNNSQLQGEISLNGLPDVLMTFIYADIHEFISNSADLNSLSLPGNKRIHVPEKIHTLGLINYRGMFTGFINDFVAFGTFTTDLGTISTDLLFKPDTLNYVEFNGRLTADGFDMGRMMASENIGKVSLSANVNGNTSAGNSISALMEGVIQQVEVKGYNYNNISLSGALENRTFSGSVNIMDPNIELEFLGTVDLTDSVPAYDFTAYVAHADFYELNIDRSDPDFTSSFRITANATGKDLNSLNGEIRLENSSFRKGGQDLAIKELRINATNTPDTNLFNIRSDFVDLDVSGKYEPDKIKRNFLAFLNLYLPSLNNYDPVQNVLPASSLLIEARIKNIQPALNMFFPGYHLAENSSMECSYSSSERTFALFFNTSDAGFKIISLKNLGFMLSGDGRTLKMDAGGSNFIIGSQIDLQNFTVISNAFNDSINIETRWNNWKDIKYNGNLKALAHISSSDNDSATSLDVFIKPTTFFSNDSLWNVSEGKISLDGKEISFDNIRISHDKQYFSVDGIISNNPEEVLGLIFNDFNLTNLNGITENMGYHLAGILNGRASFSDLYKDVLFTSELSVDSLSINNEMLGQTQINSTWDDVSQSINIDAFAMRDNLKTLTISGKYSLRAGNPIDFNIVLDKFRVNLFNPYAEKVLNDLRGIATGTLSFNGTIKEPVLNGNINFQKTSFGINYLNTRYSFSEDIKVTDNNIYFKNLLLNDGNENSAYVDGSIKSKYLKDFEFDLTIRSDKFLCLNTKESDNSMFYGTAYAQNLLFRMTGPVSNLTMDISAGTAENTVINIPLSEERELSEYNFITVLYEDAPEEDATLENSYQVNATGMQINIDLAVTPDAEVQIIFDPKLGDIIKGKGSGDLDMRVNTRGDFVIYGEYTIQEGDYLFTLQNFINKKLTIEEGGTIRWSGDPFDATIDVVATYRIKASLNELLATTEENSVVVDDRITMTGKLMSPDIKYDIYLPYEDEETRLKVNSAITSSEELNKQFISLLVQQRFIPGERAGQASGSSASAYTNAAGVSASEFLTNQLSNWLSQISNDFDVGINYRSNPELKNNEVQVALSTQLFNDKLSINGSVDVPTNAAASTADNIVGEFDIDYKLTKNGKFRIKTYNHVNNIINNNNSQYTQGLGIFYKEEFRTVRELWKRYWQNIFGIRNEENKEIEEEGISNK